MARAETTSPPRLPARASGGRVGKADADRRTGRGLQIRDPGAAIGPVCQAPDPDLIAQVVERVRDPKRDRWLDQVARAGHCSRPIRLRGRVTRRTADGRQVSYSTAGEPDGVLLVRCGNRRASVCPACSYEYRGDMWQMLVAGLAGGRKGVPESVREHPALFVTLTAPGFGAVHTRREDGRCRPRRAGERCPHGREVSCGALHDEDDQCLGQPLCPDCYDYEAAALFNWFAPELWRRFTIALRRSLARRLGVRERDLGTRARVSFAKVAEFQRRGAVHLHAIIRLDGPDGPADAPDDDIGLDLLGDAVREAAERASVRVKPWREGRGSLDLAFGTQLDLRPIASAESAGEVTPEAVAAYVSKYATKACEDLGVAGRRLVPADLERLALPEHVARMVLTVWALGEAFDGMRRWTHTLGFRGHFATKSRAYSVTLGSLRQARADYRREQAGEVDSTLIVGEWEFAGIGYLSRGDLGLAEAAGAHARERRELLRMERRGP